MPKKFCKKCFLISFVALVALAGGYFASTMNAPKSVDINAIQSSLKQATLLPSDFRKVPAFDLNNQNGESAGAELFNGKWSLVFFGYTHCPDVCPASMSVLKQVKTLVAQNPQSIEPQVVFVSVDPKRDTPDQLNAYMAFFDKSFVGLSGSDAETLKLSRTLGIVYKIADDADTNPNYLVDHSSSFLLINPDGGLQAILSAPHEPETVANDFQKIVDAMS